MILLVSFSFYYYFILLLLKLISFLAENTWEKVLSKSETGPGPLYGHTCVLFEVTAGGFLKSKFGHWQLLYTS